MKYKILKSCHYGNEGEMMESEPLKIIDFLIQENYIEVVEENKQWIPKIGQQFYVCTGDGGISIMNLCEVNQDKNYLKQNNVFKTKEEATMESLFRESCVPNTGKEFEGFYIWNFYQNKVTIADNFGILSQPKFATKEEAQEWGDKYAKVWIEKFNK